jgi:iron-sulfur cluster repair protein YtfE (RIC family)
MNAMRVTPVRAAASSRGDSAGGFNALDACHRQTFSMLDELSALVTKLEHDGLDAESRVRAAKIAAFFSTTAREHHEDEERHIFPALVKGAKPEIVQAVLRLQQDHDWLEEGWFEIAPHVQAIAAGRASYDIETMREGVAVLAALYHDHIELEESFIYPEARARMPSDGQREMGREMAVRHHAERVARHAR